MGERDQLGLEAEQDIEHVLAQDPVVRDRDELQVRVLLLGQDLPRDKVRVVCISVRTITSPRPMFRRPREFATRLMASVALRVQTMAWGIGGTDQPGDLGPRALMAAVARSESW